MMLLNCTSKRSNYCRTAVVIAAAYLTGCAGNVGRPISVSTTDPVNDSKTISAVSSPPVASQAKPGSWLVKGGGLSSKSRPESAFKPATLVSSDQTPIIRPDQLCKSPNESYNFTDTLMARIGQEGVLRLTKLFETDFKKADLKPQERQYLKILAKEMLWIPASVEEQIGNAMLAYASKSMTFVVDGPDNEDLWDKSAKLTGGLLAKAPKTPFQTRLVIVENGEPQSLAGGLIFIDMATAKAAFDDKRSHKHVEKLNFIVAHELAHIYKRHRAKRLQQLLVDTDTGLKLTRSIFSTIKKDSAGKENFNVSRWVQTAVLIPELIDIFRKHNALYEQDQEFEADACATALMMASAAGNPVAAFATYREDQVKHGKGGDSMDLYASHPPNKKREEMIRTKYRELSGVSVAISSPSRERRK